MERITRIGEIMSHESQSFRRAARACGGTLQVVPVVTGRDWMEEAKPVGRARNYTRALRLVRDAGYRVMTVGGLHGLSPQDEDIFFVTVYP